MGWTVRLSLKLCDEPSSQPERSVGGSGGRQAFGQSLMKYAISLTRLLASSLRVKREDEDKGAAPREPRRLLGRCLDRLARSFGI